MRRTKSKTPIARTLIATAISACFAPLVFALPLAPTVASGSASFVQSGSVLTVTNSDGAIINWQSFSIGSGETTRFVQASASSSVLNRVLGSDPSLLLGALQSNGRVFLINRAGILVGRGARIDVAGFVASTLTLSDSDYLAKRLRFTETPGAGKVQNFGAISTPGGGSVYLVAPQVENHGLINAPNGEVLLAAGQRVELLDTATPGVRVEIVGSTGTATNLGRITAEAGRIGIAGVLVRNAGTLDASSVVSEGGRIFLKAAGDIIVDGQSQITATGSKGGRIEVLGKHVELADRALIDASGQSAGGTVLLGGDYQGQNTAIQNAQTTRLGQDVLVKADAIAAGQGGKVIVWADDSTSADGNISARGGVNGGDGGFVEVSGKRQLLFRATADTRAPLGKTGTLLLDPTAINLIAGAGTDVISTTATLFGDNITTNLGLSNVILQTSAGGTGNITFTAGNYNFSAATAANSLSLLAFGDGAGSTGNIALPSGTTITMKVGAPLTLVAGWDGASVTAPVVLGTLTAGHGDISMVGSSISAQGGGASIAAAGELLLKNSSLSTVAGPLDIKVAGNITLDATTAGSLTRIEGSGAFQSVDAGVDLKLLAGAGGSAIVQYFGTGTQTVKGGTISVLADASAGSALTSNHVAEIHSNASQVIQATSGGITVTGGGFLGAGTNHSAGITASGDQQVTAAGSIALVAGGGLSANSVFVSSNGNQVISAAGLTLQGGSAGHDNSAQISAQGNQTISALLSGLSLIGGGTAGSYNNQAAIRQQSLTGSQKIVIGNGSVMQVSGGNGDGATPDLFDPSCPLCPSSRNGASVSNKGSGGQEVDFLAGGSLQLTGGSLGSRNNAQLDNESTGVQKIWSSNGLASAPSITITGGASGGYFSTPNNENIGNSAEIGSKGAQTIHAASLTLNGGGNASTVGGAFLTGVTQNIQTTGNLTMTGGGSDLAGMYGLGTPALIGEQFSAAITLVVGGSLQMIGGSGLASPVLVGSAVGPTAINITAADIAMTAGASAPGIGALTGGPAGTLAMSASSGAISQGTNSRINSSTINASAAGNISLDGINSADNVSLSSSGGLISYHSANAGTTHIAASTSAAGSSIDVTGDVGSGNIALGALDAGPAGTVQVAAQNAILDDNGTGVANATGATVTLRSELGAPTPGTLAISADVDSSGVLTADNSGGAVSYGGILVRSVGAAAPSQIKLQSKGVIDGSVAFQRFGDLLLNNAGNAFQATPAGNVGLFATGNLTLAQNLALSGGAKVGAGGALTVTAGNTLSATALDVAAASLSLKGSMTASGAPPLRVNTSGALLIDGGTLSATGSGHIDFAAGTLDVINGGQLLGSAGITGMVAGAVNLGAATGSSGSILAGNGIVDLTVGGTGIALFNGSQIKSIDATQAAGGLVRLSFPGLSAGGSTIDGSASFTANAAGGGYFVAANEARLGAGLEVRYGLIDNPVLNQIIASTLQTSNAAGGSADTSTSTSTLLAAGSGPSTPPLSTGGSETNSFGSGENAVTGDPAGDSAAGTSKEDMEDVKNAKKKPAQCTS